MSEVLSFLDPSHLAPVFSKVPRHMILTGYDSQVMYYGTTRHPVVFQRDEEPNPAVCTTVYEAYEKGAITMKLETRLRFGTPTASQWVPDLTQCGDVESNPGPPKPAKQKAASKSDSKADKNKERIKEKREHGKAQKKANKTANAVKQALRCKRCGRPIPHVDAECDCHPCQSCDAYIRPIFVLCQKCSLAKLCKRCKRNPAENCTCVRCSNCQENFHDPKFAQCYQCLTHDRATSNGSTGDDEPETSEEASDEDVRSDVAGTMRSQDSQDDSEKETPEPPKKEPSQDTPKSKSAAPSKPPSKAAPKPPPKSPRHSELNGRDHRCSRDASGEIGRTVATIVRDAIQDVRSGPQRVVVHEQACGPEPKVMRDTGSEPVWWPLRPPGVDADANTSPTNVRNAEANTLQVALMDSSVNVAIEQRNQAMSAVIDTLDAHVGDASANAHVSEMNTTTGDGFMIYSEQALNRRDEIYQVPLARGTVQYAIHDYTLDCQDVIPETFQRNVIIYGCRWPLLRYGVDAAQLVSECLRTGISLILVEDDEVVYSKAEYVDGLCLRYNSHDQTCHVQYMVFEAAMLRTGEQIRGNTRNTIQRIARKRNWYRAMPYLMTTLAFTFLAASFYLRLRRYWITTGIPSVDTTVQTNVDTPYSSRVPIDLEHLSHIARGQPSAQGILDAVRSFLDSPLENPALTQTRVTLLGYATDLFSSWLPRSPNAPATITFSRFVRNCLADFIKPWMLPLTKTALRIGEYVGYGLSITAATLVHDSRWRKYWIQATWCQWFRCRYTEKEAPRFVGRTLVAEGVTHLGPLHSSHCSLIKHTYQNNACDCHLASARISGLSKALSGVVPADSPEMVAAMATSLMRSNKHMGLSLAAVKDAVERFSLVHSTPIGKLVPAITWGHLVPYGCAICGTEGVRCVHKSPTCHCGLPRLTWRGKKFCGRCDPAPIEHPGLSIERENAIYPVAASRGLVRALKARVVPFPPLALPSVTAIKGLMSPQLPAPRKAGVLVRKVEVLDVGPLAVEPNRAGCNLHGIVFPHVAVNVTSNSASATTAIYGRQNHHTHTIKMKCWPLFRQLVLDNLDMYGGFFNERIRAMPWECWLRRFPTGRKVQLLKAKDQYLRFGLQRRSLRRKSFLKNELSTKGGFAAWEKHREGLMKTREDLMKGVPVFDEEGLYSKAFTSTTTTSQRKHYAKLDRTTRWLWFAECQCVLDSSTVMLALREIDSGNACYYAPRNITGYEDYTVSAITGPHFVAWMEKLKHTCNRKNLFHVTCGQDALGIGKWFDQCREDGYIYFASADAERFDASVDTPHFELLEELYRMVAFSEGEDFWTCVQNMRHHRGSLSARSRFALWWEQLLNSSRGSGDNDTTAGNSLLAMAMHYWSLARFFAKMLETAVFPSLGFIAGEVRVALIGDDIVWASKKKLDLTKLNEFYAELGFNYEIEVHDNMYQVSFMGGSPFPVVVNGKPCTILAPDLKRFLPKIGMTANLNVPTPEWVVSVALGWRHFVGVHPLIGPIIEKYLEVFPPSNFPKIEAFQFDARNGRLPSHKLVQSKNVFTEHHMAYFAVTTKYGITTTQMHRVQNLIKTIDTLPCMVLTQDLESILE